MAAIPAEPVTVSEVDVVGSAWQAPPAPLPRGTTLISSRVVHGFAVDRFLVRPGWRVTPTAIGARAASSLLGPQLSASAVLIQRTSS